MNQHSHFDNALADSRNTVHALCSCIHRELAELREVLATLAPQCYVQPGGPRFHNATIGAHVRHTLDHLAALIKGVHTHIEYDARERGTLIESRPDAACTHLDDLIERLQHSIATLPDTSVRIVIMPGGGCAAVTLRSTLARELAFIISHTVHHKATIKTLLSEAAEAAATFGLAPATLQHRDVHAQSRSA
jgi:uncharacterized damage-inducible protein DinB